MAQQEKKQNLLFYEVCDGDLARDAQIEFERMQKLFERTGKKVTMSVKLTLYPSEAKRGIPERFKEVDYEVIPAVAKKKSDRYVVEVSEDGCIIGQGKSISDALQIELRFEDALPNPNTILFEREAANEQ